MARTQQFFLDVKNKKGILLITLMFLLVIFHNVFNQSFKHWDVSIVLLLMTIYFFYKKTAAFMQQLNVCFTNILLICYDQFWMFGSIAKPAGTENPDVIDHFVL